MNEPPKSNRREFLRGRAAVRALQGAVERRLADDEEPPGMRSHTTAVPPTYLVQITLQAMAAEFEVYLNVRQHPQAEDAALAALELVEQLEDQLTVYRPHSEVMTINREAAAGPVRVEPRLFALLEQALALHRETGGAFDITSGPLSRALGFYRRAGQFAGEAEVQAALTSVGSQWIELDANQRTIRFRKTGLEINLNAIGKGYALDRCAAHLQTAGIEDFLLHGGQSSVLARGSRAGVATHRRGWTVALRHPLKNDVRLAEIRLHDRALGTSGSANQFFYHQGRRFGHVLDPRTGWPVEGVLSTTVLAPTAALADALSTAFFVMGWEASAEYCRQRPELAAIFVCPGARAGSLVIEAIGLTDQDWQRY